MALQARFRALAVGRRAGVRQDSSARCSYTHLPFPRGENSPNNSRIEPLNRKRNIQHSTRPPQQYCGGRTPNLEGLALPPEFGFEC